MSTGDGNRRSTAEAPDRAAVPHLTVGERAARGRAARAEVPRRSHAGFEPASTRPDPIGLLEQQAATRVPELVPIRYGRMAASPFAFYRGAALVMASDLAGTPRSGITVQACGDAHGLNFGVFGSAERKLLFDVNDFDETTPGPWEWDIKRLTASLTIAARERGMGKAERRQHILNVARDVFAKRGYHAAKIDDIVASARIAPPVG